MRTFYSHRDEAGMASLFSNSYHMLRVHDPADADIIIWNGGADIATSLYGEMPIPGGGPLATSSRDEGEVDLFNDFRDDPAKLLLGICRGSQLLNCLNGGTLYQDVNGHHGSHPMLDLRTGEVLEVTSTHHQQMRPNMTTGEIIGVASRSSHRRAQGVDERFLPSKDIQHGKDVEIVWYPDTRSLCVQGHPEYVPGSRFAAYTLELINQCVG